MTTFSRFEGSWLITNSDCVNDSSNLFEIRVCIYYMAVSCFPNAITLLVFRHEFKIHYLYSFLILLSQIGSRNHEYKGCRMNIGLLNTRRQPYACP